MNVKIVVKAELMTETNKPFLTPAHMIGRNGTYAISHLIVRTDGSEGNETVSIEAISEARGVLLHGGIHDLQIEDFDVICEQWLKARGFAKSIAEL